MLIGSVPFSGFVPMNKGAVTDALKKSATLFGVGLELYGEYYEAGNEAAPVEDVQSVLRAVAADFHAAAKRRGLDVSLPNGNPSKDKCEALLEQVLQGPPPKNHPASGWVTDYRKGLELLPAYFNTIAQNDTKAEPETEIFEDDPQAVKGAK